MASPQARRGLELIFRAEQVSEMIKMQMADGDQVKRGEIDVFLQLGKAPVPPYRAISFCLPPRSKKQEQAPSALRQVALFPYTVIRMRSLLSYIHGGNFFQCRQLRARRSCARPGGSHSLMHAAALVLASRFITCTASHPEPPAPAAGRMGQPCAGTQPYIRRARPAVIPVQHQLRKNDERRGKRGTA